MASAMASDNRANVYAGIFVFLLLTFTMLMSNRQSYNNGFEDGVRAGVNGAMVGGCK